jgi:hypothetical protein
MQDWLDCRLSEETMLLRSPQRVRKPALRTIRDASLASAAVAAGTLALSVRSERVFVLLCAIWLGLTVLSSLIFIPLSILTDSRFVDMTADLKKREYEMTVMSGFREKKVSGTFDDFASVLLRSELISDGLAAPFRQQSIFLCWSEPKRDPLGPIVFRRVSSGGEFGNQRAVAGDLAEAMGLPLIDDTRGRRESRPTNDRMPSMSAVDVV